MRVAASVIGGNDPALRRATVAGLCSALLGIGLARFAYTPLLPAVIAAHWFPPGQASWLAAANLGGYLAGALGARPAARRFPLAAVLRVGMAAAALSFLACAWPAGFGWFFLWRVIAGAAGGVLMVLATPAILALVPPRRRGLIGGIMFTGVGFGIAASGALVPPLLHAGLTTTWLALAALGLALTVLAWPGFPNAAPLRRQHVAQAPRGVLVPILVYGLNAVGLVPHMIFLVDFVARELGRGIAAGSACWVAFGLGAMIGPTVLGVVADRLGFAATMRLGLGAQALAVALPVVADGTAALWLSAAVAGAFTPAVVTLMIGRIHTVLAPGSDVARAAWSRATVAWAVGQAAGGQVLALLFTRLGSHIPLFGLGAGMLVAALVLDLVAARPPVPAGNVPA